MPVRRPLRQRLMVRRKEGKPMADDLSKRGPQDRSRVNVNEDWEVRWWCKEFGCTEAQLRAAVRAVGVSVAAVRKHLQG
jgi:hypothetical protein